MQSTDTSDKHQKKKKKGGGVIIGTWKILRGREGPSSYAYATIYAAGGGELTRMGCNHCILRVSSQNG